MQVKKEQKEQLEKMRQGALAKEAKIVKPLIPEDVIAENTGKLKKFIESANAKMDGIQGEIKRFEDATVCSKVLEQVKNMLPQMSPEYASLLARLEELRRLLGKHEVSVGIEVARVPLGVVAREELQQVKRLAATYKHEVLKAVSNKWDFEDAPQVYDLVNKSNKSNNTNRSNK